MLSQKDCLIISHLRNNARKKITVIANETKIPVTTIYDRVRVQEKKLLKKHVTLLDFAKLGLHARAQIAFKVEKDSREALRENLLKNPNVNSLLRVNYTSDFLAEVVFKNIADMEGFVEELEKKYHIENVQIYSIIEELKREAFLTKPEHFSLIT